jgi:ribosomal protein L22
VPEYSKIKWSNNAVILILHFCHLIADKKYSKALDRLEALEKYSVRHLRKKNESFRLNCFLKMLLEIPKAGFHRAGVQRKAAKYRVKLDQVSIADTRQQIMTEVVPFEDLWDMILDSLDNKHARLG